eukprot:GHVU01169289.1.p1 GENE.GHVU01169289.1~~GHVU01169289.1.p1  ORF type:complete len:109 (-),score=8.20 GHVU01169289.1:4-330(-)
MSGCATATLTLMPMHFLSLPYYFPSLSDATRTTPSRRLSSTRGAVPSRGSPSSEIIDIDSVDAINTPNPASAATAAVDIAAGIDLFWPVPVPDPVPVPVRYPNRYRVK